MSDVEIWPTSCFLTIVLGKATSFAVCAHISFIILRAVHIQGKAELIRVE
jgi:hypothetical protein